MIFFLINKNTVLFYVKMLGLKENFAILRVVVGVRALRFDLGYLK